MGSRGSRRPWGGESGVSQVRGPWGGESLRLGPGGESGVSQVRGILGWGVWGLRISG